MEHTYSIQYEEAVTGGEFSFHPFLASFIRKKFLIKENETIIVYEKRCTNSDCPIHETIVEFGNEKKYILRFFRKKEQINKLDLSFAKLEELE